MYVLCAWSVCVWYVMYLNVFALHRVQCCDDQMTHEHAINSRSVTNYNCQSYALCMLR